MKRETFRLWSSVTENDEGASKRDACRLRIEVHAMCGCQDEVDHVGCLIISLLLWGNYAHVGEEIIVKWFVICWSIISHCGNENHIDPGDNSSRECCWGVNPQINRWPHSSIWEMIILGVWHWIMMLDHMSQLGKPNIVYEPSSIGESLAYIAARVYSQLSSS